MTKQIFSSGKEKIKTVDDDRIFLISVRFSRHYGFSTIQNSFSILLEIELSQGRSFESTNKL